jgi:hypothetical protein
MRHRRAGLIAKKRGAVMPRDLLEIELLPPESWTDSRRAPGGQA